MGQPRSSVYARFSIPFFFPQGLWIVLLTAVFSQVSEQKRDYLLKKSAVVLCRKLKGVKHQEFVFIKTVDKGQLITLKRLESL